MSMKVVFVKRLDISTHERYLLETPVDIKAGELLLVDNGTKVAAVSPSMEISDNSTTDFAKYHGTILPLSKVVGRYREILERFDKPKDANESKVREVNRLAKTGEYIKIIDGHPYPGQEYGNGDILKVACTDYNSGIFVDGIGLICREEYVVLEGYTDEMYQNYLKNKDDIKWLAKNG